MNNNGLASYFQFKNVNWPNLWSAAFETIWMTIVSILIVAVFGLLLGLLLYETSGSNSKAVKALNWVVALFVNVFRSIPFIILIVLLLPVTQVLVGAITGAKAAIPSLVFSAAPFYARLVEIAFHEVDGGVLEAAESMGATKWQLVFKVLIPESLPALVSGNYRHGDFLDRVYRNGRCNRCRWSRAVGIHGRFSVLQQRDYADGNGRYRHYRVCFPVSWRFCR